MSGIDASRLAEELNALLEQGRIVTWLDRNGEYAEDLDAVRELLDDATLITINANLFETKLRIFAEDTKSRYVLYRGGELPPLEEDLLADVRCGYPTFKADASTLLVRELGVDPRWPQSSTNTPHSSTPPPASPTSRSTSAPSVTPTSDPIVRPSSPR